MIVDSLKNSQVNKGFSDNIYAGLKFLHRANLGIDIVEYSNNNNVKAIVSEYNTVEVFERGYKSRKLITDIQFPIRGLERVKWSPIEGIDVNILYDEKKDQTFLKTLQNKVLMLPLVMVFLQ